MNWKDTKPRALWVLLTGLALFTLSSKWTGSADMVLNLAPESTVLVHGKTNVNQFCCQAARLESLGPISAAINRNEGRVSFSGRGFRVQTKALDCGNRLMNADLQKTLNSKEHPYIQFALLGLRFDQSKPEKDGLCRVKVVVSGQEKVVEAPFQFLLLEESLLLFGKIPLRFSDFQLDPPRKLGGAIVVKQDFEVEFQLYFRP